MLMLVENVIIPLSLHLSFRFFLIKATNKNDFPPTFTSDKHFIFMYSYM